MDLKFEGLERTTTPEGVYRVLRAAILDGTVPPVDSCARGTSRRISGSAGPRSARH